jgi:hypothetical protein
MPKPLDKKDASSLVCRRHPEWAEHHRHWRFLADSLEGGNRYKHADYTIDPTNPVTTAIAGAWYTQAGTYGVDPQTSQPYPVGYQQICDRNLVPHLREMSAEGRDLYASRISRTPTPRLVDRACEAHLSKVYGKEIRRNGPDSLTAWWEDADGKGNSVDRWMRETVAPLLLTLGQLDLCFDHPPAPEGADVRTQADVLDLGLADCVASIVLPENAVWWRLDGRGCRYAELLVFERTDLGTRYRHWTADSAHVYTVGGDPAEERYHDFGRVPVVRVFDRRKPRCTNTGKSRYDSIAELQRAVYNATSELILSDTQQSHAQLMGPEDFLQSTSEIPIGPDHILPMKKSEGQNGGSTYQGFQYLDPPKGAQEALRQHVIDFKDDADRDSALMKPAGMTQSSGTTAQSGISKIADQQDGNAYLVGISESLEEAEKKAAAFALVVLTDGRVKPADLEAIDVGYPRQFDLFTADDLATVLDDLQKIAGLAGALPETEGELLKRLVAVALPGLEDSRMGQLHDELDGFLKQATADRSAQAQMDAEAQRQALPDPEPWGAIPPGAAGSLNVADKKFLKEMIPHHEMAIKMAETVIAQGSDPRVDALAKKIHDGQAGEVKTMKAWLAGDGETPNAGMSGMGAEAHRQMTIDGSQSQPVLTASETA